MNLLIGFGEIFTWGLIEVLGAKAKRTKNTVLKVFISFFIFLLIIISTIAFNIK